jgi:hypothetical protein
LCWISSKRVKASSLVGSWISVILEICDCSVEVQEKLFDVRKKAEKRCVAGVCML